MERPKTKRRIWFSMASIFLLVMTVAVGMASNAMAQTGSFDRDGYLPDLGSSDFDRAWISVTDSSGNTTTSQDTITVTVKAGTNLTSFILKETGATTTVFTTTGGTQSVTYPVGTTSGYVEDFNSGSHNYPALGTSVVGLNLRELTANTGGDATTATDGNLTVATGDTLELLYKGSTLDTAPVRTNSGSFTFNPSSVSAITTNSSVSPNLIISLTDQDENLNPVLRDVIGFADNSAFLSGSPGTGSSRVQIEAIDQTTGSTLSLGGTSIVARNIMLVETGNNTGIFTASGKVFGTSTTVSSSDLMGNLLVGSSTTSAYSGSDIILGDLTNGPGVRFKIIEVNASGRLALYEAGTTTTGPVQPVLGFVTPASGSFVGTSSLSLSNVVAMGTTTCLFGVPSSAANQGTNSSGVLKLIEGNDYCLVAISQFIGTTTGTTIGGAYSIGNGGSVTVSLSSFQLAGPRSGDTLKLSYLDELNGGGTSGTVTATLLNGVAGETGTLAFDNAAPDINDLVVVTVVDGNLNTSTSTKESVAAGSSLWGGTTTNNRGDRLTVKNYNTANKTISVSHPDGFAVGTQTVRISNTDNSLVWVVPTSLTGTFQNPLSVGSTSFSLGTESVSTVPLVRGSSSTANSFLGSASTSSFLARLDGLDNTVEISPDGTRWVSVPIVETGANSSTFVGTVGFDFTAARLTTNTATSITALISDFTGTSTIIFQDGFGGDGVGSFIGTGSVVRIFDGTAQEFAEVTSAGFNTLSVTKLSNSTSFDPDKTWVHVIGNDMMPERLDTNSAGSRLFRIGGYCGATYRIRYNDALGLSNVYMAGDNLAITTSNMGFTANSGELSTDITGSTGPDTFVVVTLVDQDLNTNVDNRQTTFENDSATGSNIFNEDGLGLPSGSSTGNVSRGFKNGGTSKIIYASTLSSIRSSSLDLSAGGNAIDFSLVETANNSGTFRGSFQLSSSTSTTNSSDILKVSNGNSVFVTYIDSPTGTCGSNDVVTDPIAIVTSLGTLNLSKDTAYLSGDTVVATVVDVDRNTTLNAADTLTSALKVTGANFSVGTDLNLNLVENGVNTSTFIASFKTGTQTDATTTPQTIRAVQDGILNVVYTDTSPQAQSAVKQVLLGACDATMVFDADTFGLDTFALITLSDCERNTSITSAQTLLSDVFIRTSLVNNTVVRMVETGNDTGIFTGSIKVASSGGTTEFNQIQAAIGDTLTISYIDEVNTTGSSRTVTDTATVVEAVPTPTPTPTVSPTPTVTPTATPPTGSISGQVTDDATNAGIAGANVAYGTSPQNIIASTTTDADGNYSFTGVVPGTYAVVAQADGFQVEPPQIVTVDAGEAEIVNFALTALPPTPTPTPTATPTPGSISGQVTDSVTGDGIPGANVAYGTSPQNIIASTTTDADGNYSFTGVVPGTYAIAAQATGYQIQAPQAVTVGSGEAVIVDFSLTPLVVGTPTPTPTASPTPTPVLEPENLDAEPEPLRIQREQSGVETVTVTSEDGSPVAGVTVTAEVRRGRRRIESISPTSAVTDANGQATFTITATRRTGRAKVRFEADGLRDTVTVRVTR